MKSKYIIQAQLDAQLEQQRRDHELALRLAAEMNAAGPGAPGAAVSPVVEGRQWQQYPRQTPILAGVRGDEPTVWCCVQEVRFESLYIRGFTRHYHTSCGENCHHLFGTCPVINLQINFVHAGVKRLQLFHYETMTFGCVLFSNIWYVTCISR